MAETLVEKTCTPCRGGIPPLTRPEAEELLPQAPEWALMDDARRIENLSFPKLPGGARIRPEGWRACGSGRSPSRHQLRLGVWDRVAAHQEDQGSPRERFHHGGKDRSACVDGRQSCLNKLW